jgi:hypothetical protein
VKLPSGCRPSWGPNHLNPCVHFDCVFVVSFFSNYFGASVTTNWYQSQGLYGWKLSVRVRVLFIEGAV